MYESVAKLPCGEVTVAKLPCGEVTGNPKTVVSDFVNNVQTVNLLELMHQIFWLPYLHTFQQN